MNMPTPIILKNQKNNTEDKTKTSSEANDNNGEGLGYTLLMNSNEDNIINMPTYSKIRSESKTEEENKSLMEKTREKIHEKVATEEQLFQEKPKLEQIQASLPKDPEQAVDMAMSKIKNAVQDAKDKFNERIDEGTEREQMHHKQKENNGKNILKQQVDKARNAIYEVTKSPELKEKEEFASKSLVEKMNYLNEKGQTEPDEPVPTLASGGTFYN